MKHMTAKKQTSAPKSQGSGKRFDEDFRREAVALLEAGRSATQLSRELGVSTWSLSRWKTRHAAGGTGAGQAGRSPVLAGAGPASSVAMADELVRLRTELGFITRQRDILKKALGILGQEQPGVIR
jgi:transposase